MFYMIETITKNDKYVYTYVTAASEKEAIKKADLKNKPINVYEEGKDEQKRLNKELLKKLNKAELLLNGFQLTGSDNLKLQKKLQKKVKKVKRLYLLVKVD